MGNPAWIVARMAPLLFAGLGLMSCTAEGGPPLPPGPGAQPGFCTREYDPVCAERRGNRQTFGNSCLAEQAGYRIVRGGECRSDGGGRPPQQFCTNEYAPVCARRGGDTRTFGNECQAETSRYSIVHDGECRGSGWDGGGTDRPPSGDRFCTQQYEPVCARRGRDMRTFGNECEADAAGYRVIAGGEC